MPKGSKLKEELKQDEDGTILIPKEAIPEVPITVAKKAVKRQLSEKQMENAKKLGELSKARWEKLREEKARLKAEQEAKEKEEEKKLIEAGTHVRVKVAAPKPRGKNAPKQSSHAGTDNEIAMPKPLKLVRQPAYEATDDSSDHSDTDVTETEEDTDVEEQKPRYVRSGLVQTQNSHSVAGVRKQVKKNLKVLARVDEALAQTPSNPYLSMLQGRWR
jgi:hypothetical protein